MNKTFPRLEMADVANISATRLDYMIKLGMTAPDVGDGPRKKFSLNEARIVVIAARASRYIERIDYLAEPLNFLRMNLALPGHLSELDTDELTIRRRASMIRAALAASEGESDEYRSGVRKLFEREIEIEMGVDKDRAEAIAEEMINDPAYALLADEAHQIDRVLWYRNACRDKGDCYYSLVADGDEWRSLYSEKPSVMDGDVTDWATINIRALLKSKDLLD